MRHALAVALGSLALLLSSPALPCGAPFGPGMQTPTMNILVIHKAGVETYVFQPHFCGEASDFGLILPIPAALSANPALAGDGLFASLATISAPTVVKKKECSGKSDGVGGAGPDGGWRHDVDAGTQVIDAGQVGIFDWVLLRADTAKAFTDWLDANGYPHTAAADPLFAHYVTKQWYFVAFKVNAGEAPPAGTNLCGDLGPIQLSFAAATPVVPTRIAAAAGDYYTNWTLYGIAAQQLGVTAGQGYEAKLGYSGALAAAELAAATALAALAAEGDRLVKIDLGFYTQVSDDLVLAASAPQDFRATVEDITYVDCGDCSVAGLGASGTANLAVLLVPLLALAGAGSLALRRRR